MLRSMKTFKIVKLDSCIITFIFMLTYNVLTTLIFHVPILPTHLPRYILHTYVHTL